MHFRFPFELITEYTQFRETVLGKSFFLLSAVVSAIILIPISVSVTKSVLSSCWCVDVLNEPVVCVCVQE